MKAIQDQLDRLSACASQIADQADPKSLIGGAYVQSQVTQAMLGTLVRELEFNGGLDRTRYDNALVDALRKVADDLKAPSAQSLILQ